MCFSAEASFSAGILLTAIGAAAVYVAKPKHLLLAMVPLLFALQQISEGFLWLRLEDVVPPFVGTISQVIYMFFAFLFWPVWSPLACWAAEEVSWRRGLIAIFLLGGILLSLSNVWTAFGEESKVVKIFGKHLYYVTTGHPKKLLYLIFVLVPPLISSLSWMWLYGILVAASYALALVYHPEVFASVWCFFAAVVSSSLFFVLWKNNSGKNKNFC
jgi:hypothetical protein